MAEAETYEAFEDAAIELERFDAQEEERRAASGEGELTRGGWGSGSRTYDVDLIDEQLRQLQAQRAAGNVEEMMFLLRADILRNLGSLDSSDQKVRMTLSGQTHGVPRAVRQYMTELKSQLISIAQDETVTGSWTFNGGMTIDSNGTEPLSLTHSGSSDLTITQSGAGNLVLSHTGSGSINIDDHYTAAEVDALIAAIDEFDVTADYSPSGTWTFAQNKLVPTASFGIKGTSTGNANVAYMAFNESNGSTRQGYIGYGSGSNSILTINNERTDGQVRVLGHDGTTLRNMLILDPDSAVGTTNSFYTRNNLSMTTRYYAESGLSTAGQIKHHRGTMFDIGMNVSPRVATNISFTWTATEAGCTAYYNSGAYTITLPSSSDIPTDAQMQVWSISTSNITIAPGSGASLYWVNNGVTTTGTRTLNRGMCTIWKYSTGVYFIVGTGLS